MALFTEMAVKEQLKARVAVDGPTGSGKTWTAMQWAVILAGGPMSQGGAPIGVIDTENRSAAYYAPTPGVAIKRLNPWDAPYEFLHLAQRPPYNPIMLAQMIEAAHDDLTDDGVLVVDSLTHYWNGEGGTLDIVDKAAKRTGNSFTGWQEGTPAQRHLLDTIIHAPFHVIVTMRSKMEYVLQTTVNKAGNSVQSPTKIGMAPEQRAGVEYEFTIVADMDLDHRLFVSKSRCDVIADVVAEKGRSAEVAHAFKGWLNTGVQRLSAEQAAQLTAPLATIEDDAQRFAVKKAFVETFGKPTELSVERLDEAVSWVIEHVAPPAQSSEPESQDQAAPDPVDAAHAAGEARVAEANAALIRGPLADAIAAVGAVADVVLGGLPDTPEPSTDDTPPVDDQPAPEAPTAAKSRKGGNRAAQ